MAATFVPWTSTSRVSSEATSSKPRTLAPVSIDGLDGGGVMISRRSALRLLSLSGAAALLAACGPAAPSAAPTAAPPASTQAPAAAQPKRGGNLNSTALPLARLDAHCFCGGDAFLGIWDTLIGYDDKSQPTPNLLQKWDANSQLTQITLTLRQGVMFHSGRELTSEDVKYNFSRTTDP